MIALQQCPTVPATPLPSPRPRSLIEIQGSGTGAPLFLVHGVGGGMIWGYHNFVRYLGTEYPVYAFTSRGLEGEEELPTIREIAEQYVNDLRAFQPHGPYRLGGYCFGGNVAQEMSCQLRAQGEKVELLVLLNCAPLGSAYERGRLTPLWAMRFAWNLTLMGHNFLMFSPKQKRDFLRWKWRTLCRRLTMLAPHRAEGDSDVDNIVDLASYHGAERRLWASHVRALCGHRSRPGPGRIVLVRSPLHDFYCSFDHNYGWSQFAPEGVTVRVVPGPHDNILDEPYVRAVAEAARDCLKDFRPRETQP